MTQALTLPFKSLAILTAFLLVLTMPSSLSAEPTPEATAAYNAYIASVESRLARQHHAPATFLALPSSSPEQERLILRQHNEPIIESLTPPQDANLHGALLHHWRGTAFAPGAHAADFERLMRNFNAYPERFAPQITTARILSQNGNQFQAQMRVRQRHVITVVLDTTYDITFGQLDPHHGYSLSRSNRIAEIDSPGTSAERALNPDQEHGFLWRLNTYWSYEERDGGLYMQVEAVSLTRSIPSGLGWAIRPYINSIPRESLEFTLASACKSLRS